jgi:hypothetical protein
MTRVTGGAKGVLLESKWPLSWAYADMRGFILDFLKGLNIIVVGSKNLSHTVSGKFGSTEHSPAMKCFLKV